MALRAAALLAADPDPDDDQIRAALEPNVCRCGCYPRITRAVHRAAALLRRPGPAGSPSPRRATRRRWPGRGGPGTCASQRTGNGSASWVTAWWWCGLRLPRPPGRWPPGGGAWVHVAPSGVVTAFTGKVDVGQDNQTAFRLLVAEELAVRPGDVRMVQGDTDLCPFDIGTFGSRSMPDGGEPLRRAAAGARQVLLALAARRWGTEAAGLTADAGAVTGGPGGARLAYGELVAGLHRLEVLAAEPPLTSPASLADSRPPGHAAPRLDVVTGDRRFVSDLDLPGMLARGRAAPARARVGAADGGHRPGRGDGGRHRGA